LSEILISETNHLNFELLGRIHFLSLNFLHLCCAITTKDTKGVKND